MTTRDSRWSGVYAITIGVMALIIGEFLPVGTLTPMAKDLGVTEGMAGQAVSTSAIFATVTSLFIAFVSRKYDRKNVILVLTSFLTISNFIVAFASNFTFLLIGRVLLGIAVGGMWSMASAIALRLVSENDGPKAISFVFAGSSFASILAAPLGSFLGHLIGWRYVFILSGAIGIVALIWQAISLPSLPPRGNVKLRTILEVLKLPQFVTGLIIIGLVYSGRFASFTFLRPFLERVTNIHGELISVVLLIFGLSYFVGNWFSPSLIKNHLRSTLWAIPALLSVVGLGITLFGPFIWPTFILVFLWGSLFGPVAPAWSTWITKKAPEFTETGGGLFVAAIQGSAAIGAFFGGIVFDQLGPIYVMVFSMCAWLIASIIAKIKI